MLRALAVLALLVPVALSQTQTITYSYGGLPLPIFPDDWNTISIASIDVPRNIQVSKVTVSVQVQFSGVGDLNLFLWSPIGTRTKLLERNCGSLVNIDTTFDDGATTRYADFCPATAGQGPFRGNEPLGNSNGQSSFGRWRLGVENNGSGRTGTLTGWSITITGTTLGPPVIGPNTVVSLASLVNGSVAPGDTVAIFGVNLGSTDGIRADATKPLPTSLGSTSVTFDGVQVPMFYASDRFVVVQAPFGLTVGTMTQIVVTASTGSTLAVPLTVVDAKPAVITYETNGHGQAKALNSDGSLNGSPAEDASRKPAKAGDFISIYATGLGIVSPALTAGTPPPTDTLSTTVNTVTANIGGEPATVLWAGAAPTQTGAYQLNVVIPPGTPSGVARLVLTSAGNSSQPEVRIQIQ